MGTYKEVLYTHRDEIFDKLESENIENVWAVFSVSGTGRPEVKLTGIATSYEKAHDMLELADRTMPYWEPQNDTFIKKIKLDDIVSITLWG